MEDSGKMSDIYSCDGRFHFLATVTDEDIRREKEKARALRKTQWWQRHVQRGICRYCGKPTPPGELTMDHIVPLIRGGRSSKGNVAPACKECNNRKKYLLPVEWEEYLKGCTEGTQPEAKCRAFETVEEETQ